MEDIHSLVLNVEIVLLPECSLSRIVVQNKVKSFIENLGSLHTHCSEWKNFENTDLYDIVQSIDLCDVDMANQEILSMKISDMKIKYHIYQLNPRQEFLDDFSSSDTNSLPLSNQWLLPSEDFHGLWENLIFDPSIKSNLLNYASTMMLYSDKKVNNNIIIWNRVVLLHGPPGSGKTSLCKALAQKLCIRFQNRYKYGHLVEVNSHSLFSKWFSESGKLVMRMFNSVKELVQDNSGLVILLIDEVESLTRARSSSIAGTEPSDAIRVVNALLTQIDSISRYPNVLILTTSNLCDAIDLAFVDRADIKQYIGIPTVGAIYQIYCSCINELMKVGIISPPETLMNVNFLELAGHVNDNKDHSLRLYEIARLSEGLSGRTLRKIPLIAHSLFIQETVVTMSKYLDALTQTVTKQFEDLRKMSTNI